MEYAKAVKSGMVLVCADLSRSSRPRGGKGGCDDALTGAGAVVLFDYGEDGDDQGDED